MAKGFDTFCPVSNFIDKKKLPNPEQSTMWLKVDGQLKQDGKISDMIFSIPTIISEISRVMTLNEGDLILTGTPKGVGPVRAGQVITAGLVSHGKTMGINFFLDFIFTFQLKYHFLLLTRFQSYNIIILIKKFINFYDTIACTILSSAF